MHDPILYTIRTSDGEESSFFSMRSIYAEAVMEAVILWDLPVPCHLTIWVPKLLPDYGPYDYVVEHRHGALVVACVAHLRTNEAVGGQS